MKLKVKFLELEAGGKSVVVLNKEDAEDLASQASEELGLNSTKES